MTWIAHATRTLTTGQLYWTIILALTGAAMAVDTIRRHTHRHTRHQPRPRLYDWAADPYYRQACNVHRNHHNHQHNPTLTTQLVEAEQAHTNNHTPTEKGEKA